MNIKLMLIISIIGLGSLTALAQDPLKYDGQKPIEYDFFGSNKLPLTIYLKKGTGVNFKITNFNKSLYTISVNNTDRMLFNEVPSIFKVLTEMDISKLSDALKQETNSSNLNDNLFSNKVSAELAASRQAYRDKLEELGATVEEYNNNYNKLKTAKKTYINLEDVLSDDCRTFAELKADKLKLADIFLTDELSYKGSKDESSLSTALLTETGKLIDKLDEQYVKIGKLYGQLKLYTTRLENGINDEQKNVKDQKKKAETLLELSAYQKTYKTLNELADETITEVKAVHANVETYRQENFPAKFKKIFDRISEQNFTYISPVFKAKSDLMTMKFTVEPKTTALNCSNHSERLNGMEIEGIVTGFKMNFSTGLFANMGSNIFDKSYKLEAVEGDTEYNRITKNDNKTHIAPAVGALMHFYNKRPAFFSWGGAFGLSISNETKLNYHGGLSALFGEDQRIILSAGATLAKVQLLSDEYKEGGKVLKSVTSIPYGNFYRWGYFLSLTYNLAKL